MLSHSEVLGIRALIYKFGEWGLSLFHKFYIYLILKSSHSLNLNWFCTDCYLVKSINPISRSATIRVGIDCWQEGSL